MAKNTKLICTVVPNPYQTKKFVKSGNITQYHFSVFISPRLPESGKLKDYYEVLHWYEFFDFFRKNTFLRAQVAPVTFDTGSSTYEVLPAVTKPVLFYKKSYDVLAERVKITSETLYQKLFPASTPVSGWILDEGEPVPEIKEIIPRQSLEEPTLRQGDGVVEGLGVNSMEAKELTKFAKDTAGHDISEDELRLLNKENQEFHKKLSVISDYPHLMRLTGWICDFYIELADGEKLGITDESAAIRLDFSASGKFITNNITSNDKWRGFFNEVEFLTPWTYVNMSDFSIRYSEVFKESYFTIDKGFIRVANTPIPVTASQFSIQEFKSKKLQQLDAPDQEKLQRTKIDQSSGISLFTKPGVVKQVIEANPDNFNLQRRGKIVQKLGEVNINDYIIFGHNIDTGYRVDVAIVDSNGLPGVFHSLCKRLADYTIDTSPYTNQRSNDLIIQNFEDEPWIAESAQAGKSGTLYVDEELCRWNNWSLTCPHVGDYKPDETEVKEGQFEFNDVELENIAPHEFVKGKRTPTLLPLRFGQRYAFRLRVVDLCGNSPSLSDSQALTDTNFNILMPTVYERFENVEPPEMLFGRSIYREKIIVRHYEETQPDGTTKKQTYRETQRDLKPEYSGEDLTTLVIRTFITLANKVESTQDGCIRFISPPRVTPQLAQLHGVFDAPSAAALQKQEEVYNFLSTVPDEVKRVDAGDKVPFVTDPIVSSVEVHVDLALEVTNIEDLNSHDARTATQKVATEYFQRRFLQLALVPTKCVEKNNAPIDKNKIPSRTDIVIQLPAGTFSKGTIKSKADTKEPKFLKAANHEGVLNILCVHAVQRPIFGLCDGDTVTTLPIRPVNRTPDNPINIRLAEIGVSALPTRTSEEIRVRALYRDYVRDPKNTSGNGYMHSETKVLVTSFSNIVDSSSGQSRHSLPGLKTDADVFASAAKKFQDFSHSFGDTKYRPVSYQFECISRFRDFFEQPKDDPSYFSRFFNLSYKENEKTITEHQVLNSQQPKVLNVDKIVPVLAWEDTRNRQGEGEVIRRHDTFRIYFTDTDWFSSGEGESVACLLWKENTVDDDLLGLASEFGKDPAVAADQPAPVLRLKGDIVNIPRSIGFDNSFDTSNTIFIDSRVLQPRTKASFNGPAKPLIAVAHNIRLDDVSGKFYVDITIDLTTDPVTQYFPFVKFALARHQPNSINQYHYFTQPVLRLDPSSFDYRFSEVITAPQAPLLPERRLVFKGTLIELITKPAKTDYRDRKNEVWLIGEPDDVQGLSPLILDQQIQTPVRINYLPDNKVVKGDLARCSHAWIEEYEYYEVDEAFSQADFEYQNGMPDYTKPLAGYNPRNDIRKRLVFTYQLK